MMFEIESGKVQDRPWGATLAAIARAGQTGVLRLRSSDDKVHRIAFERGKVVGATSPLSADSVARIALAGKLVTPPQVAAFNKRARVTPAEELDVFVLAAALRGAPVEQLKRRVLVQRAARTFTLEQGEFSFEEHVTIPVIAGMHIDVRSVVYHGARLMLDQQRLITDLHHFGTRFVLAIADAELAPFEFGADEGLVLAGLRKGTSTAELEAMHRDLDPRMVQAVIYALAACGAIEQLASSLPARPAPTAAKPPPVPATKPPPVPATKPPPTRSAKPPPVPAKALARKRTARDTPGELAKGTRRWTEPFIEIRPTTVRPNPLSAAELRELLAEGGRMLERGVDHFTMLGVPIGASVETVRSAYIELARNLRAERLAELRVHDQDFRARALLAQISIAYTVLTEPARRAEYFAGLRRSPLSHVIDFSKLAAEAFERGERALRADEPELAVVELRTACELAPDDIDYITTLGRAEFSANARKTR
jgi:hypothetical protein